jgi:hypothetical protein
MLNEVVDRLQMAVILHVIAKDQVVPQRSVIARIWKQRIAGERHAGAVNN